MSTMTSVRANADRREAELLAGARGGDEAAFAALVGPLRRQLLTHCYRMLGSASDAEDAVQDALLRAWGGIGRFEGRSAFLSWLYRIATNSAPGSGQALSRGRSAR